MHSLLFDRPVHFNLDMAGVLGLLDEHGAVSAMVILHVYGKRRWLGWYNNPGSFKIYERLGSFTRSSPLHNISGISSGVRHIHMDPRKLLNVDALGGPKFVAAHSGTVIEQTGYLATLLMNRCAAGEGKVVQGRQTQPVGVTVAKLHQTPDRQMEFAYTDPCSLLFSGIPIAVSVGTCIFSALFKDWYAFSSILVGILANGISCYAIGLADSVFTHPEPAQGSPAGDGILGTHKNIVLLRGTEGAVNAITHGTFSLRFECKGHLRVLQWCSVLFLIQCITQLFLIPQASLFGQAMFLVSLAVSLLYNIWLSVLDNEKLHRKLLFERVLENPELTKFTFGTRTTAVVFILLVLGLQDPTGLLDELLPNDTRVWKQWKTTIVACLCHANDDKAFKFGDNMTNVGKLTQQEKDLLTSLYGDARMAYAAYVDYKDHLQADHDDIKPISS